MNLSKTTRWAVGSDYVNNTILYHRNKQNLRTKTHARQRQQNWQCNKPKIVCNYYTCVDFGSFHVFSVERPSAVFFVYKQTPLFIYKPNCDIRGLFVTILSWKLTV